MTKKQRIAKLESNLADLLDAVAEVLDVVKALQDRVKALEAPAPVVNWSYDNTGWDLVEE